MFSNHIINKGMTSLSTEMDQQSPSKDKNEIITEEILYLKILTNHKLLMITLLIFHLAVMALIGLNVFYSMVVIEDKFICKYASNIKNIAYLGLNFTLVFFAVESLKRNKAILSNIYFYERNSLILLAGMLLSFLIIFFKFFPDFFCSNHTLPFFNCALMTCHIFFENLILYLYITWFKNELRSFGALLN